MSGLNSALGGFEKFYTKIDPAFKFVNNTVFGTKHGGMFVDQLEQEKEFKVQEDAAKAAYAKQLAGDGTGQATGSSTVLYGGGATSGNERVRIAMPKQSTSDLLGG